MPATLTTIDSLMRGVVGPSVASGDGSPVPVRLGRNGELIIGNGHGKYYEQVARGKCYHASMQAGASMGTALTATAVTLTLYNPVNSGMLLSLIHANVAITTVPGGAGNAIYALAINANPLAAVPATNTPAVVRNCLLGAAAGVGIAYTATTLPAAPVIARVLPGGIYWATAAAASAPMVAEDWVDGSIVLAPNTCVTIQGIGVATSGIASLMWEEIPLLAA